MKTCEFCKEEMNEDATHCPHCSQKVNVPLDAAGYAFVIGGTLVVVTLCLGCMLFFI